MTKSVGVYMLLLLLITVHSDVARKGGAVRPGRQNPTFTINKMFDIKIVRDKYL